MLESYDKELAESRDKKQCHCEGKRQASIKTVYGSDVGNYRNTKCSQGTKERWQGKQIC